MRDRPPFGSAEFTTKEGLTLRYEWSPSEASLAVPVKRRTLDDAVKEMLVEISVLRAQADMSSRALGEATAHLETLAGFGGTVQQARDLAAKGVERTQALALGKTEVCR